MKIGKYQSGEKWGYTALYRNTSLFLIFCVALSSVANMGCKKLLEVPAPVTNPSSSTVYTSNATAAAVLTGIYSRMISGEGFASSIRSVMFTAGLLADEFQLHAAAPLFLQLFTNNLSSNSSVSLWPEAYQYIYSANSVIEGISASKSITEPYKRQLIGEAKFIRAFFYFYLVNLFGDVPLVLTTDYQSNASLTRTSKEVVYGQIIKDLKDCQPLLQDQYLTASNSITEERVRPNKFTATALLARVYLYTGNWNEAEIESSSIINNTSTYSLVDDLNNVFLKNSSETIWQLLPTMPGMNNLDAKIFILNARPSLGQPVTISPFLENAFEANDKRFVNWIGSLKVGTDNYLFPFKYKVFGSVTTPVTEYLMVFRLAEQFLIRAEARAQQNNISGAQNDLSAIRNRAGLSNTSASDKTSLLNAIVHERQVELFTEWGHRWLDLKRTGLIDSIMSAITPQKGGTWNSNKQLYPLPISDLLNNQTLRQNPGY